MTLDIYCSQHDFINIKKNLITLNNKTSSNKIFSMHSIGSFSFCFKFDQFFYFCTN